MSTFAERLKAARKLKGLTQEKVAEGTGVSRVAIVSYEQGLRSPGIDKLIDIVNFFEMPANYFLGLEDYADCFVTLEPVSIEILVNGKKLARYEVPYTDFQ